MANDGVVVVHVGRGGVRAGPHGYPDQRPPIERLQSPEALVASRAERLSPMRHRGSFG